jgi:DinB superfamily
MDCDACQFDFDAVRHAAIRPRVIAAAAAMSHDLRRADPAVATRSPSVDRWSATEYAAHTRDVLLTIRDRLVIGIVEEHPGFKPLYREERVTLGLYRRDPPADVADELRSAAAMFGRLFDAVDPKLLDRTVAYGFPDPETQTLLWMGRQAVHETEHHLADVRECLRQ